MSTWKILCELYGRSRQLRLKFDKKHKKELVVSDSAALADWKKISKIESEAQAILSRHPRIEAVEDSMYVPLDLCPGDCPKHGELPFLELRISGAEDPASFCPICMYNFLYDLFNDGATK